MSLFAKTSRVPQLTPTKPFEYYQNGDDWGENISFCETGREQSPIDLTKHVKNDNLTLYMSGYSNYDDGKFLKHTGASL